MEANESAIDRYKRTYGTSREDLPPLPKYIRSKMWGNTLTEYTGEDYILKIHGGTTHILVQKGDYIGHNTVMSRKYIRENPDQFEML